MAHSIGPEPADAPAARLYACSLSCQVTVDVAPFGATISDSPGVRLAYTSEHLSLAMIEYFVHLDRDDPPPDLVVAAADVPDDVSRVHVAIGDRFATKRREAILVVPSALAPDEFNWLLNPDHPDLRRVRINPPEPFSYDARFLA